MMVNRFADTVRHFQIRFVYYLIKMSLSNLSQIKKLPKIYTTAPMIDFFNTSYNYR